MIQVLRETKTAPWEIKQRVAHAGGVNRFGEPNFRVVWGWSRLTWIGGKWTDHDASGNVVREIVELREVPKYTPHDRWHIERWTPPEAYGPPEEWYRCTSETENGILIPALGPYPARGEYEHSFTLAGPRGEFIPLDAAACDAIVRAVERSRVCPPSDKRAAIAAREARRQRASSAHADAVLSQ